MLHRTRITHLAALALCCAAIAACKQDEAPPPTPAAPAAPAAQAPAAAPFAVSSVELGKQVGADKKVTEPTSVFAPGDTIYASVSSTGAASSVTLKARWTYEEDGQLVNESSETIAPTGPTVTEFHIGSPSGFPLGKYKLVISTDGTPVQSREFVVQ